jgi:hypothetical protein
MHYFGGNLGGVKSNLNAFNCHFNGNEIHLHCGSSSFLYSSHINYPRYGSGWCPSWKGGSKRKYNKIWEGLGIGRIPKSQQFFVFLITRKGLVHNFDNLCFVKLPLFSPIFPNLMFIDEELYLHEFVFGSDPLQLGLLV